jgi:hypothetical protein
VAQVVEPELKSQYRQKTPKSRAGEGVSKNITRKTALTPSLSSMSLVFPPLLSHPKLAGLSCSW